MNIHYTEWLATSYWAISCIYFILNIFILIIYGNYIVIVTVHSQQKKTVSGKIHQHTRGKISFHSCLHCSLVKWSNVTFDQSNRMSLTWYFFLSSAGINVSMLDSSVCLSASFIQLLTLVDVASVSVSYIYS